VDDRRLLLGSSVHVIVEIVEGSGELLLRSDEPEADIVIVLASWNQSGFVLAGDRES